MTTISGKTRLLGIFGDPVAHSLSPAMQNAALAAAGIDAAYLPFHVRPDDLAAAVAAIRALGLLGVNITVPHKQAILPFLDEIAPDARLIGAVNTVLNRDGRLVGYNTDAPGFLSSLLTDLAFDPRGKRIVVLGAGGACRAALTALAGRGAHRILVANRTQETSTALIREMQPHYPLTVFESSGQSEAELGEVLNEADLLVNTTTIGLHGETFPGFIVDRLPALAVVYDMVYAAGATPLLASAARRGLRGCDGRGMLVAQGEEAFYLWFDRRPQGGVMRAQVA